MREPQSRDTLRLFTSIKIITEDSVVDTLQLVLLMAIGYTVVFYFMALWNTRNLKEAFYEWKDTMLEWRNHAVPGIIFILTLALIGYLIGH